MSLKDWLMGKCAKPEDVPGGLDMVERGEEHTQEELISFSVREFKESVTLNGLDPEWVEYVRKLAAAEGDPPSVFMRKRLLEGLGAYLAGKNRNAWKAYKAIGEARENF